MSAQSPSFIAGGNVSPSRFVKPSGDHGIIQAGAGDEACGVSHEGTREAPITGITPLAAIEGESCQVYTLGWPCEVEAAATIVAGDKLKPNADGKAVVAEIGEIYSAIARAGAASGERCKATVSAGVVGGEGIIVAAPQALSGAGAINVTTYRTDWTTTGAQAGTLADGVFVGQKKKIQLVVDGGDGTLTPASFADGTSITFADAGDFVVLRWDGEEWNVIEKGNDADGATAPVINA